MSMGLIRQKIIFFVDLNLKIYTEYSKSIFKDSFVICIKTLETFTMSSYV